MGLGYSKVEPDRSSFKSASVYEMRLDPLGRES